VGLTPRQAGRVERLQRATERLLAIGIAEDLDG
jgi:hypothetical protein